MKQYQLIQDEDVLACSRAPTGTQRRQQNAVSLIKKLGRLETLTFTAGASFPEELGRLALPTFTVGASFTE